MSALVKIVSTLIRHSVPLQPGLQDSSRAVHPPAMHFTNEERDESGFCGCSDDSVLVLWKMSSSERSDGAPNIGARQIVECDSRLLQDLGPAGTDMVEWCKQFLFLTTDDMEGPTLADFVWDFLKMPRDSGYDYWLMNFLEWNGITEHGIGIRTSWSVVPVECVPADRAKSICAWMNKPYVPR